MKTAYLFVLIPFLIFFQLNAQQPLQSPAEFLGYELGDRFTPHHKVLDYFNHVAATSPGIKVEQYGETYENRPLIAAFISTPENMGRLESIRKSNLKKAGLIEIEEVSIDAQPAIVWFSYNVHGNESVSTEAAMATIYDLANPGNEEKQTWLKNTVVIIDPCLNPDGRARYVNWYKQAVNRIPNPSADSREHHEPWPGGRGNHYLFDLNRDWAWQTQLETKARLKLYNQWLPQVHVDFHEQSYTAPYYFAPAAAPFHELVTDWQREFQTTIGKNNAKYFDENNWLYFTRERFDLFYPSYGDTYPTFNGAIGMTYEQGGSGRAGLAIITAEGDTLTLKERIDHHHTTGLSTIEATSKNAEKVLEEFSAYFKRAVDNPAGKYKTYVIKSDQEAQLRALKDFLEGHQIKYGYGEVNKSYKGYQYMTNQEKVSFELQEDDIVISAAQPKSVLIQVLFEPQSALSDSVTYDITAWAVPYMFGVQAFALTETINPVQRSMETTAKPITFEKEPYAYLTDWNSIDDARWLSHLLQENISVRFAEEAFEIDNKSYEPGSLIITRNGNNGNEKFDSLIINSAREMGKKITPAYSGFVSKGKDFGSGSVRFLEAPRVAIVAGNEVSSLAFGEVWHFFEQEINYQVTILDAEYLKEVHLPDYDVLIFPSGDYANLFAGDSLATINGWIRGGGKLILMEDAMEAVLEKKGFGIKRYFSEEEKKIKEEEVPSLDERLILYKDREREAISDYTFGSIYQLRLDNSHPLAFGYPDYYFTLKNNSNKYAYLTNGWNVGIIENDNSLVSGFAGYRVQEKLSESLIFGLESSGEGQIIYMADNPLFRAFWHNGKLLFANAVFMVGQ